MAMALRIFLTVLVVSAFGRATWADGGSDHGHDGGTATTTATATATATAMTTAMTTAIVSPRVEARLGDKQLVLIYVNRRAYEDTASWFFGGNEPAKLADPRIVVFLEGFSDAVPTSGAKLEAVINFIPEALSEAAPGVYLSGPVVLAGGRNEIELNYTIGEESGALSLMLQVPGGATQETGGVTIEGAAAAIPSWFLALVALAIYASIFGLFLRRQRNGIIR